MARDKHTTKYFIYLFLEVFIFTLGILFYTTHTVLLAEPSKPYSKIIAFRLQTNALLQGHLALSPRPFGAPRFDYVWTGHGLQQNWGLGVPFLWLPFEWVAGRLGLAPFPDRITLLFYVMLMVILLNAALRVSLTALDIDDKSATGVFLRWLLIAWIMCSPGFSSLVQVRLDIYYEAVFYGCIYSYFLLALFLIYILKPSDRTFLVLCSAAGLAWLIRPTLIAYGLTTVLLALFYAYQHKCRARLIITGILCSCIGVGLDLWFNHLRFGSMLEFGYSGVISGNPRINFTQRFDYPYHHEPFFSAARELIGRTFFYNLWPGSAFRGRVYEFHIFNLSHFVLFVTGLALIVYLLFFKYKFKFTNKDNTETKLISWCLFWGAMSFGFLFLFYVHFYCLASRYLCDFSAAIHAVLLGVILFGIMAIRATWAKSKFFLLVFLMVSIPVFYFNDKDFLKFDYQSYKKNHNMLVGNKEAIRESVDSFNSVILLNPVIPDTFRCGDRYSFHIKEGLSGWRALKDCSVKADTTIFLPARKCLTVNYTMDRGQALPPVQVKRDMDLFQLTYSSIEVQAQAGSNKKDVTQTFCSDSGIINSLAFYNIGWIKAQDLKDKAAAVGRKTLPIRLNLICVSDSQGCKSDLKKL